MCSASCRRPSALVLCLYLVLFAPFASAAITTLGIALDTDNNAGTGCTVTTANGPLSGIEQVANTIVTTTSTGASVTRLERQICNAGTLGAPSTYDTGGWSVGLGVGTAGTAVVETSVPLAMLPSGAQLRASVIASNATNGQDATSPFSISLVPPFAAAPAVPIPLSPWLVLPLSLLVLAIAAAWRRRHPEQIGFVVVVGSFALSGLVWAATVIRNGDASDWAGIAPATSDATGDAPANADLIAVFWQQDATNLYVRIDADIRTDTSGNQPPQVSAGASQTITLPANASLSGTASDDGLPNPPGTMTLAWTKVSGPGTVTFANPSSISTNATFSATGVYVLRLTASDSVLSASADVTITVNPAGPGNLPPTVSAGANQTITLPASATLAGSATDDGLPNPPGALTLAWSKLSGPGTVTFGNATSAATTATFSAAGVYVLRLTANDGALAASADVTITANVSGGSNAPPVVNAGANQTVTLPAAATLNGSVTDDGLPNPPGALTIAWSLVSGPPTGVSFANAASPATTATFMAPGLYELRLSADDGTGVVSSTVQITVSDGAPQLVAIADRTITLGNRFQQVLQAVEGNLGDTLTFALDAAPTGATLNPAPIIDWVPSAAQLGAHTFTARVTDSGGRFATVTFRVTVVKNNRGPTLAPQADVAQPINTAFARTLAGTDPDGDALTFTLVSGPTGLVLTGSNLGWTTPATPGNYTVTVRVADPDGATDTRTFTIKVTAPASPMATDDSYQVQVGQTLTVPASGVLANDFSPFGRGLTAQKLSDPDKGTLSAFNADGSFTYQAPATNPPIPFGVAEAWRNDVAGQYVFSFPVVGDVNGDGFPDLLLNHQGGTRAVDGRTGATLWNQDSTGYTDCYFFTNANAMTLADIDDDGKLEYVGALAGCERDTRITVPGYAPFDRMFAFDASTGRIKWASPRVSASLGDVLAPGNPPSTEGRFQHAYDGTLFGNIHVTRFSPTAPPTLLFRANIAHNEAPYGPIGGGPNKTAGCRGMTGDAADHAQGCRMTILMSGVDGTILAKLKAPNPSNMGYDAGGRDPWRERAPFTVDLDGDGQIEIVSGSDVWKSVGGTWTLLWQSFWEPIQALTADLDGDGHPEIVHFHAMQKTGGPSDPADPFYQFNGLVIRDGVTGAEKSRIRLPFYWTAWMTIADPDGDGKPDFVINSSDLVMVVGTDGRIKWTYTITQRGVAGGGFSSGTANVQVYDLDGDGINEVVTNSQSEIVILNGRTGTVKAAIPSAGTTAGQHLATNVQIVDADNDGHADIVAQNINTQSSGVFYTMIRGAPSNWLPGPKIHHQVNFMIGDVADNGRVLFNSAVPTSFRNPKQLGTVDDPRRALGTSFTYAASDGTSSSGPATVFIEILPPNRPPVITSTPPRALWQHFTGTPPTLFVNYYDVAAYDPDPGDTLTYSLTSSPPQHRIDAATGRLRFEPTCGSFGNPCPWGWTYITVRVTDSRGAFAEQSFMVNLTNAAATVPSVIGQPVDVAMTLLQAAGLQGVRHAEQHDVRPIGTVLNQIASAGATVAAGDDVLLTLSKGPQPVVVPFVVGQDLATARLALQGLGLGMSITPQASSTVPRNEVMTQTPAGGTLLAPSPTNVVALTVSSGALPTGTIANIVVEPGNAARLVGDILPMKATAIFADGTASDVTLNALWSSTVNAVASVDATGFARALAAGFTQIRASVGSVTGQTNLTVAAQAADVTPPTATITTPTDGADVVGPVTVTGTATDANFHRYELAIAPAGESTWTVIAQGTSAVSNGTLGTLDPATLVNDQYTLRLTVVDRANNMSEALSSIQVRGDRKVGLFTLTFQDLNVALTGVPITISRTYDSRDKAKGDFGVGWRLGWNTLRLRTNRVLGTGWLRVQSGISSSLQPRGPHKVSLALPDGRVEEFDLQLSPTSGVGVLQGTRVTGFAPRAGTLGQLEGLDNPDLLIVNDGAEDVLVDDGTLDVYDPKNFRYTMLDGTTIEIHRSEGVRRITDRNGNAITFGRNGVTHSAGPSVVFTRDAQDRITSIRDLNGNTQSYGYDANGDLVAHTDPTGGVSTYKYDRHHGLIDMRNPAGTSITRNDYDPSGRLISMTDALGRQITFTHNEAANEDIVTNRLGHQTKLVYDAQGNITRQERAVTIEGALVNAVTSSTYDAQGNETSTVDPDGKRVAATFAGILPTTQTIDPAGLALTTTIAYNARSDVTQATDAGGRPFGFTYDASGNLTGASFPDTGAMTIVGNASGDPIDQTDAIGTRTVLARDAAGRVTREEIFASGGALLRRMDFTWDANGNKTSETLHRTIGGALTPLTTRYTFDAANRLVATTDALGGVWRTEYDANGLIGAEVDALGRRTSFVYDTLGRKTRTNHPDGSFEASTYDAEGNEITSTDRAGRTSTHDYDEAGRRVKTTLPDGTSTRTIYTPAGRIAATIDAQGNRTDYVYDAAGRQTTTMFPPVANGPGGPMTRPQVHTAFNALGAPASRTDANGRVTIYSYDAAGRLVRTSYPDGTSVQQAWDARGRRSSVTNEEGEVTTFGYDGLGRLVSVSGLAGDATFAYDEAGNIVQQTDALGRITTIRYDALNRPIEQRYPGGETVRHAYDAVGNVASRTDGLGRVATFAYDAMNRLTAKTLPGGATVRYTYAADGSRASVVDARGTTTYAYDVNGRLQRIVHPGGETLSYAHDANGNITSIGAPGGTQTYAYDALDRLVQTTAPEGATHIAYDLAGNRLRRTAANGIVSDVVFDMRNRPTSLVHKTGAGATLQSYAVTYSPSSRRTRIAEADGSVETFAYDVKGRLAAETRTGTAPYAATHAYDAVGNRVQSVRGGTPTIFAYDVNDRLLSDGTATYAWDANGNLATRTAGGATTTYGFDAEDRLVAVAGPGVAEHYGYDADGHRVEVATPALATRFLVDTLNPTGLSQVLEERTGAGTLSARYSYAGERVGMQAGGAASVYLADSLGSVRALADQAGALSDRYVFDAYGNAVSTIGGSPNPYRYRGERFDAATGFYQLRARYYGPSVGRFISRDPFAGRPQSPPSLHRYLYANGDPIGHVDPDGRESLISLTVAQSINNTMRASEAASRTNQACNAFSTLGAIGYTVMAAQLAYGFAGVWFEGWGAFKTSISVFAVNPAVLKGTDIKSTDFRLEPGPKLKLAFSMKDGRGQAGSIGPDGFNVSYSGPIKVGKRELKKELKKCETIPVGSVQLKATTTNWMGLNLPTLIPAISIEVELLKVIRNEWKLFDGISVDLRSPTGF